MNSIKYSLIEVYLKNAKALQNADNKEIGEEVKALLYQDMFIAIKETEIGLKTIMGGE